MAGTTTPLGVFAPRCELCGGPAPPRHGSSRGGGFLDVRSEAVGLKSRLARPVVAKTVRCCRGRAHLVGFRFSKEFVRNRALSLTEKC